MLPFRSGTIKAMSLSRPEPQAMERRLRWTACALAALFVLLFLWVAMRRLRYPFEVDRMESGMMASVWRLAHGHSLYSPPSMEWVPFLYAPLFFYVSAALAKLTGLQFATLRLVSTLSTLGSFAVIYALVFRETRRHAAALVAVGLFACLYDVCIGWYDVGRVDSLSVFLFLVALYATRWMHPLLAALAWALAFSTKQTFLPFGLLSFLPFYRAPRRMMTGIAGFALLAAASVYVLNHSTGGWYSRYAFGTTREIAFIPRAFVLFVPLDIFGPLPVSSALILAAVLLAPPQWRSLRTAYYGGLLILLVGAIGFVRAHVGANVNAVIPVYAWMAVVTGLAVDRLLLRFCSPSAELSARNAALASSVVWLALTIQLLGHIYQPGRWIPARSVLPYRDALLSAVRNTPGDVWLTDHPFDGVLAGKPVHPDMDALDAVLGKPYPPTVDEFNRLIADQHFAAILTDRAAETYSPKGVFTSPAFQSSYGLQANAPGSDQPGLMDQPRFAYVPCDALRRSPPVPLLPSGTAIDASGCEPKLQPANVPSGSGERSPVK